MIKYGLLAAMLALLIAPAAHAAPEVGKPAPEFSGTDSNGKTHKLSDFKGKIVVLEWNNPECPYVVKHYDSKNMQGMQAKYAGDDVVWLTINSGAEGKQGHLTGETANAYIAQHGAKQTAYLLDPEGTIGKAYEAKTTPHMFVIDKEGKIAYMGAIDSDDSSKQEAIPAATNYVANAIDALKTDKPVEMASSKPYGCGVKYN